MLTSGNSREQATKTAKAGVEDIGCIRKSVKNCRTACEYKALELSLKEASNFKWMKKWRELRSVTRFFWLLGIFLLCASALQANAASAAIHHLPPQPHSGEPVQITAIVTQTVIAVTLEYQIVEPGRYIELQDPAYKKNWIPLPMSAGANKGEFTARLPGALQKHRRLIRYRVKADESSGKSTMIPDALAPEPNFAYFVYNGVPSWRGAIEPKSSEPSRGTPVEFSSQALERLPVYHLIGKKSSVEAATWTEHYGGNEYKWSGTLVYDGKVYDHIRFRARGGVWRYAMGKNMWKFAFNKGHEFEARDDFGRPYSVPWSKLNLGACIQQGQYGHRGEHGMFEAAGFKLFNLAGIEAPYTHWVQFRIIDNANESDPNNQYSGDFWGLYLAVEEEGSRFLREHHLPSGNLYKMEGGSGELKNLATGGATNKSDLNRFITSYNGNPPDDWWRANLDLPRYYNYRAIIEGIHHYDIAEGKNYFYYLNPQTGRWSVHPWDLDLTWANTMYGSGEEPFRSRVLPRPAFRLEYQNRLREIRDLLFNTNQTWLLIDELAQIVSGGVDEKESLVAADRARWDFAPIMAHAGGNAGQGGYYRASTTHDFAGMVELMKIFVRKRSKWIDTLLVKDADIPAAPIVHYDGPEDFSKLAFNISEYHGTNPFAAVQWRIAETTLRAKPGVPSHYEIDATWQSPELSKFEPRFEFPELKLQPNSTYRVRAHIKDNTGRWSHWSEPVEIKFRR